MKERFGSRRESMDRNLHPACGDSWDKPLPAAILEVIGRDDFASKLEQEFFRERNSVDMFTA